MWKWYFVAVVFLVIGCGKNGPSEKSWPARISGHENFTEKEWAQVTEAIDYLNRGAGQILVSDDSNQNGLPIFFRKVQAPKENRRRAGLAIISSEDCTIELSDMIFKGLTTEYVTPVVDHEIGHCAGLEHTSSEKDIMSATTLRLNEYPPSAITFFFSSFKSILGFNP